MSREKDLQAFRENLVELLEQEILQARELFAALEKEHNSLTRMDEEEIRTNSAGKQKLIENLQSATDARVAFMQHHGFQATPEGVNYCIREADLNEALADRFGQLSDLAQWCYRENRLIGQLINRRTQFISKALNSLTPGGSMQNLTYEEDGSRGNSQQFHHSVSI